jgi:hypothetical protein
MQLSSLYSTLTSLVSYGWKFFAGGIVVVAAFSSNFIDLKQPRIAVEITEIEQVTSAQIDITASPEFANLRKIAGGRFGYEFVAPTGYKAEDMQKVINREKESVSDQKQDLVEKKKAFDKISRPASQGKEVKASVEPLILLEQEGYDISHLSYDQAKKVVDDITAKIEQRDQLIAAAEAEVKTYRERAEKTDAKIIVTAAVSNSGDGATTLRPQALLRTDLGQGNYLDIGVKITNYVAGVGEIKARGTSVLTFESQPISSMAPADRERFLSFFKNTSPTNLFVVDVRGGYHKSNTIPFAQGIYEQKIVDGLKTFASRSE